MVKDIGNRRNQVCPQSHRAEKPILYPDDLALVLPPHIAIAPEQEIAVRRRAFDVFYEVEPGSW
ncbi:hypothetical protein GGI1_06532 [Acidithiobacillus sp. GGI-221]|nr:hypothetical protein GGI1_06532 [Acidithiobacillus sp. GGI-221]